ncbi:MAG TPA: AI-2E family transporter [Candidatus Omnitrophota bacterium]|nr:hypothetical protein [Candidatus Omnitrophota bacterium]HRK61960.1 AI-2E family transporter [Candidatus Omnitrophota bacterium]
MKREQLISVVFLLVLVYVAWQIFSIFSVFTNAILGAAILAFLFYPIQRQFLKWFPRQNVLLSALLTALIFLIVIPPFVVLIFSLSSQIIELTQSAYQFVQKGGVEKLILEIQNQSWYQSLDSKIVDWTPIKDTAADWILSSARKLGNITALEVGALTKNIFAITLNVFFMSVLVFVFLKDGPQIYDFLYQIAPFEEKTKKTISDQIKGTFEAVIRGQILTSFAQAIVAGGLFSAVGIRAYLFFGVLTFILSMIPVGGAALVWAPLAAWLFFTGFKIQAIILAVGGVTIISLLDNVIKPAVIGEKTKLPYFLLFFGILGGLAVYGFVGVFIAPVVLSLFFALVKIYREEYLHPNLPR